MPTAATESPAPTVPRVVRPVWPWVAGVSCLAVAGLGIPRERLVWEKLLTELVMPQSLFALALLGWVGLAWRRKQWKCGGAAVLILIGYLLASNIFVANWLMGRLEQPYRHLRPLEGPAYDVLIVLGGGTTVGPHGEPQLSMAAGDRVMLAARMYHRGKARHIVCTGAAIPDLAPRGSQGPAGDTRRILLDLAIPSDHVHAGQGRNTQEEMDYLRDSLTSFGTGLRVGLLTSAWHLPRAMRLAQQAKLEVEPVPADFTALETPRQAIQLLPSPRALGMTYSAWRECLAGLVGR